MQILKHYSVNFKEHCIGSFYIFEDNSKSYSTSDFAFMGLEKEKINAKFKKSVDHAESIPFIEEIISEEYRLKDTKKDIYQKGNYKIVRIPSEIDKFWIYKRSASKGEEGYSSKDYSAKHYEGPNTPEDMKEWASWYCFNKMDDGTYEAELDEAWWWGGGHNDGGTIRNEIPEEWHKLPYDEFLNKVIYLSAAAHYKFTVTDLKRKKGLKKFFGY